MTFMAVSAKPGHLAVEEVQHELACRCGAQVAGPQRKGRQDDTDVQTFGSSPEHLMFGDETWISCSGQTDARCRYGTSRRPACHGPVFPSPRTPAVGGEHQPLASRGPDGRPSTLSVPPTLTVVEDLWLGRPETVDRRQVEHEAGAPCRRPGRLRCPGYPPLARFAATPLRLRSPAPGSITAVISAPPRVHRPGDSGPDEPRGAGNDHPVPRPDAAGAGHLRDTAASLRSRRAASCLPSRPYPLARLSPETVPRGLPRCEARQGHCPACVPRAPCAIVQPDPQARPRSAAGRQARDAAECPHHAIDLLRPLIREAEAELHNAKRPGRHLSQDAVPRERGDTPPASGGPGGPPGRAATRSGLLRAIPRPAPSPPSTRDNSPGIARKN